MATRDVSECHEATLEGTGAIYHGGLTYVATCYVAPQQQVLLRAKSAGRVALRATRGGACSCNASQDIRLSIIDYESKFNTELNIKI